VFTSLFGIVSIKLWEPATAVVYNQAPSSHPFSNLNGENKQISPNLTYFKWIWFVFSFYFLSWNPFNRILRPSWKQVSIRHSNVTHFQRKWITKADWFGINLLGTNVIRWGKNFLVWNPLHHTLKAAWAPKKKLFQTRMSNVFFFSTGTVTCMVFLQQIAFQTTLKEPTCSVFRRTSFEIKTFFYRQTTQSSSNFLTFMAT
jgi:hypothetical protein